MKKLFAVAMLLLVSAQANAFLVSDFDGKRVNIHDYIGDGRWTVVMLWQLDCIPCEQQKPAVEAFHKRYKSSDAHVVGLVMDGHERVPAIKRFVSKKPTAFPSLVVYSDVFHKQIRDETGKRFPAAPGYIVYSPEGELKIAINNIVKIEDLIGFLETQF